MSSIEAAKDLHYPFSDDEKTLAPSELPAITAAATIAAPMRAEVDVNTWQVIPVRMRLDAESHPELMEQIHEALAEGHNRIALDLTQNQFFSLAAIQLCMGLARDLAGEEGALALVGCNERTKKHFDVYGSLKQIMVVRSHAELVSERNAAIVIRPRSSRELR